MALGAENAKTVATAGAEQGAPKTQEERYVALRACLNAVAGAQNCMPNVRDSPLQSFLTLPFSISMRSNSPGCRCLTHITNLSSRGSMFLLVLISSVGETYQGICHM